jgi:FlaG/FlaF family flagellin (archaellin)
MKTIKQFGLVLSLTVIAMLSSCSSSSGDSNGGGFSGPATGSFVKATANGTNVLAEGQFATGGYESGNLVMQGMTMDGKSVNIQLYALDGTIDVGTYNVSSTNTEDNYIGSLLYMEINTSTFTTASYSSQICDNASGTIQVTFVDATKIEGTFSFTGKELKENEDCSGGTRNVTNGSFRLEL